MKIIIAGIFGTLASTLVAELSDRLPADVIVLANAGPDDLTFDNLREMVRTVAQTDKRFLKKPDGASSVPSSIWVPDLIVPKDPAGKWGAIILAADNKSYEVSFTVADGKVTLGDDAKEVVRVNSYKALTNSADMVDVLGLDNTLALDNDGWALLSPFGEHKKERVVKNAAGNLVKERYVQIVDQESVDTVIANEKGTNLFQKIKRALVKRPIYRDHPDLKHYAPETLAAGNDQMVPLGVNDGCRRTDRGLEFRPLLVPDGVTAVENDGCEYPSALFLLKKTGVIREGGWIEVRPFALASIGLTPVPNISGVDSLANANPNKPAAKQTETTDDSKIMKQLLIGWLAANNVVLANDSTDQQVWDKFTAEMATRSASIITLGNIKPQFEALQGDKTKLLTGATLPTDLVTAANKIIALENEKTEGTKMRKSFIEARVDLAITQGKAPVADRDTTITTLVALDNTKLDAELDKLNKLPVKFPVGSVVSGSRKTEADNARSAHDQVISLANNDPRYKGIQDFGTAFNAVLKDHPQLAEQLRAKPATEEKTTGATT